jgi:hypothetical protein
VLLGREEEVERKRRTVLLTLNIWIIMCLPLQSMTYVIVDWKEEMEKREEKEEGRVYEEVTIPFHSSIL